MKNLFHKLTAAASTILLPLSAHAAPPGGLESAGTQLSGVGGKLTGGVGTKQLPEIIGGLINAVLGVLGIILVVYLVWAGFLWMTASGEEEKVKKAKSMIQQAVIGMVIIIAAYAISSFVITTLTTAVG